jgi:tetratricopeptide (TPR) repeat protein
MFEPITIEVETAKQISPHQELGIIRAAFDRNPSPMMRERLVGLLTISDDFDEIVELLSAAPERSFSEEMMLTNARLARENAVDDERAAAAANRAFRIAQSDGAKAAALAARAKAEMRLGKANAARASLAKALVLDPKNKDACKRMVAIELEQGSPSALLELIDHLAKRGAGHARLFAGRALAHARSGDVAAAREAIGFDAFHLARELAPPPGWIGMEAFNSALAEELLAHPALRYERYGTASELTWRIDAPATGEAPHVRALLAEIRAAIQSHLESIACADHPWLLSRPASAVLRSWCVITDGAGHESWHVHQFGWFSGVYYVRVPSSISCGAGPEGCLSFGLPPELAGEEAARAYDSKLVRPREGLLLAFPSHAYHRTFPHGTGEKRICVAFDLRPL